jgi:hypothetical protein
MEKVRKKLGCAMPGVVGGTYNACTSSAFFIDTCELHG